MRELTSMRTSVSSRTSILIFFVVTSLIFASGDLVYSKNGMVVSASELASEVGVEILKKGGNAVDAAVATGFALAVTYPSAGNIGGGGFMVLHINGKNTSIDFRETAPGQSSQYMFWDSTGKHDPNKSLKSWKSIGIPGTVAGFIYVLEKYGTMTLEEVLEPAIKLAEEGFELDYWLANFINSYNKEFVLIPSSRKIFTNNGENLTVGHSFVQKDLAKTLKLIQKKGVDGFYTGEIADLLVDQSTQNGGLITHQDLQNYKVIERIPLIGDYKKYTILGMPLPSAGGIGILQSLKVFEKFSFIDEEWGSSKYVHTLSEIFKYVYSDRAKFLGDSDFVDVIIDSLISSKRVNEVFSSINEMAIPSEQITNPNMPVYESPETTHYSVVDKFGNAVSITYTINSSFGNKIVLEGAGFLLNNEMDDFSSQVGIPNQFGLVGSKANAIEPGKRMLSSMTPTIVLKDNNPILVLGSPGGSTIITSVLQVIINVLDFGMDIREAINAPRFHHQWLPDRLDYERFGLATDLIDNLNNRGHMLNEVKSLGRVEGIFIDQSDGIIWGSSDKRGFGKAVGY